MTQLHINQNVLAEDAEALAALILRAYKNNGIIYKKKGKNNGR